MWWYFSRFTIGHVEVFPFYLLAIISCRARELLTMNWRSPSVEAILESFSHT